MTRTDDEYAFLKSALPSSEGTLDDLRYAYFKDQLPGSEGTLADLQLEFLRSHHSSSGSLQDLTEKAPYYWDAPAVPPLNIVLITSATIKPDDTVIQGWLEGAGHNVTQTSVTSGHTGYDVIFYTESPAGTASAGSLDSTAGVGSSEYTVVSLNMATAAGTSGPIHTDWDLLAHSLNSGHPDPMVARSSGSTFQHTTDQLAAGVEVLATVSGDATRIVAAKADAGAALTTGNAAGRRLNVPMTSGTPSALTQDAIDYFLHLIDWLGGRV